MTPITHSYETRANTNANVCTPKLYKESGRKMFNYRASNTWNDIPLFVRNSLTLASFKKSYKEWYTINY